MLTALMMMAAAASGAGARFDLVCAGNQQHGPNGPIAPWQGRIKVDLVAKTFCGGDETCAGPAPIASVGPSAIVLRQYSGPQVQQTAYVSRIDGTFKFSTVFGDGSFDEITGTCVRAPFSGMPRTKF